MKVEGITAPTARRRAGNGTPGMAGRAFRIAAAAFILMVLAAGCSGHQAAPASAARPSPTATPMTAAERAWITAVTHLQAKLDKPFAAQQVTMTRAKMLQFGHAARGCSRALPQLGVPSGRLQPVYAALQKACRSFDKAARCYARAASVSGADGATVDGTPQARIQRRSLTCGGAGQGNGSNQLLDAITLARQIQSSNP